MLLVGAVASQGVLGAAVPLGDTPAFGSVGATTTSADLANGGVAHTIAHPAVVNVDDLLLCVAVGRCTNNNAVLAMHASMSAAGWQHMAGSPFESNSARTMLVAWKYAVGDEDGTNIPGGIVATGGTGSDEFLGHCQRWTAADGWATTSPFESISELLESNNTVTAAPAVTPTNQNRLAVSIFGGNGSPASFSFTGETGGDWAVVAHVTGTASLSCINTQSADLSAGTPISGGTASMSAAAGGPVVGFALAPSGSGGTDPEPTGPFLVTAFYPQYGHAIVEHNAIPWAMLNEVFYFAVFPRCDYNASLNLTSDVFTSLGHPFANGQTVQLRNVDGSTTPTYTGTPSGSLVYDTNYFVRNVVAGVSFQLSLTAVSAILNFTATGVSNGRRFKAPSSYCNRYEFGGGDPLNSMNDTNIASLFAQRDAQNPNCKIYLTLGGAASMNAFLDAVDWNGSAVVPGSNAGLQGLVDDYVAIINQHGFEGCDVDAELIQASTSEPWLVGHGKCVFDLATALRATLPPGMPIAMGAFSRSGPGNTKELLALHLYNHVPRLTDFINLVGYGNIFPNQAQQMVAPHNALNMAFDNAITPAVLNDMIETLAQYTDVGFPAEAILHSLQAGGVPWDGGIMTSPPGSVDRGARFPGDSWASGGQPALTTFNEVLFRNRAAQSWWPGSYTVDSAGDFAYVSFTGATAAQDMFWAFDSPETAAAKRAYWETQGIRGLFLWELTGDDPGFPILDAMGPPAGP